MLLAAVVIAGCAEGVGAPARDVAEAADTTSAAHVDGGSLVLVTAEGDEQVVAEVTDAELVHAAVRPGEHATTTVLALARDGARFELRYLDVRADGTVTDLYWFPWRLQVSEDAGTTSDVPTLPVWSPDGDAVAWIEWDDDGIRLRTVGWLTHDDASSNPADDVAVYPLDDDEVPVGAQLRRWERHGDGTDVLVARTTADGPEDLRIRIESGDAVLARPS